MIRVGKSGVFGQLLFPGAMLPESIFGEVSLKLRHHGSRTALLSGSRVLSYPPAGVNHFALCKLRSWSSLRK